MCQNLNSAVAVIGIDIGMNLFHVVGLNDRGAIVLRQKWSRSQIEARLANMPPCLIGMEACVGAHHLSRKLKAFCHDARLMPAKYVSPYSKGQKNDFRDAEAIAAANREVCGNEDYRGQGSSCTAAIMSCACLNRVKRRRAPVFDRRPLLPQKRNIAEREWHVR